jgi:tRNA nucleotidyltransferase (CCA-adding enzyme)
LTLYYGITYSDVKNKEHLAVEAAIREGLKLGTQNHYLDGVPLLFTASTLLKTPELAKFKGPQERVTIGRTLSCIVRCVF